MGVSLWRGDCVRNQTDILQPFPSPWFTAPEKKSNTLQEQNFMRKMLFFVMAAAALLLMVPTQNAQAQSSSETPKMEIGVQYTLLRLRDFDTTDNGVGTRVTYNIANALSVEGE